MTQARLVAGAVIATILVLLLAMYAYIRPHYDKFDAPSYLTDEGGNDQGRGGEGGGGEPLVLRLRELEKKTAKQEADLREREDEMKDLERDRERLKNQLKSGLKEREALEEQLDKRKEAVEELKELLTKVKKQKDKKKDYESAKLASDKEAKECDKEKHVDVDPDDHSSALYLKDENESEAFSRLFRVVHRKNHECKDLRYVGGNPGSDGVWAICFDEWEKFQDDCVVYSFGSNFDFNFEDHLSSFTNCSIHTFDPTMRVKSFQRTPSNWFWDLGLSDKKRKHNAGFDDQGRKNIWKLSTLSQIMKGLNHKSLWLLKIDVEFAEWEAFRQMLKEHTLDNVHQLVFEVHFWPHLDPQRNIVDAFKSWTDILYSIQDLGFRMFYHHLNPFSSIEHFGSTIFQQPCCYELSYTRPPKGDSN